MLHKLSCLQGFEDVRGMLCKAIHGIDDEHKRPPCALLMLCCSFLKRTGCSATHITLWPNLLAMKSVQSDTELFAFAHLFTYKLIAAVVQVCLIMRLAGQTGASQAMLLGGR